MLSQQFGEAFEAWRVGGAGATRRPERRPRRFATLALSKRVRLVFLKRDNVLDLTISKLHGAAAPHPRTRAESGDATNATLDLPTGKELLNVLKARRSASPARAGIRRAARARSSGA